MSEVDARGLSCPIPVVKTKKAMETSPEDTLTVLVDTETAKENVTRLASGRGYKIDEEKIPGEYRLTLTPRKAYRKI